jgi:hypothetical protein
VAINLFYVSVEAQRKSFFFVWAYIYNDLRSCAWASYAKRSCTIVFYFMLIFHTLQHVRLHTHTHTHNIHNMLYDKSFAENFRRTTWREFVWRDETFSYRKGHKITKNVCYKKIKCSPHVTKRSSNILIKTIFKFYFHHLHIIIN